MVYSNSQFICYTEYQRQNSLLCRILLHSLLILIWQTDISFVPLKGPKETSIWMTSLLDASDYSTRSTSKQAVSVTKLCKRATRTQIREDSYRIWNEKSRASRSNGQKCGEKSHVWRKWMNLGPVRPVNNKRNSRVSTWKSHEHKLALQTLNNFLT